MANLDSTVHVEPSEKFKQLLEQAQIDFKRVHTEYTDDLKRLIAEEVKRQLSIAATRDWERLSEEQQQDVDTFRSRINHHLSQYLIAESESFYRKHPELQLGWSFSCDVFLRGEHDLLPL